jgi:hypothetical protein
MRIITINQESARINGINVGIKELAILNYLMTAADHKDTQRIGAYFLPNYRMIMRDMPILKIQSVETIRKKVESLIEDGLLERHPTYPSFLVFSEKCRKYEFFKI